MAGRVEDGELEIDEPRSDTGDSEIPLLGILAGDQSGANAGSTKIDMFTPPAPPAPEPKSGVVDD